MMMTKVLTGVLSAGLLAAGTGVLSWQMIL